MKYLNSVVGCSTVLNFVNHIFNLVRPYCRHIYFGQTARCSPAFSNTPKIVRYFCCWIVRISSIDFSNIICSNLLGKPGWESYGASRFSRRHYCSLQPNQAEAAATAVNMKWPQTYSGILNPRTNFGTLNPRTPSKETRCPWQLFWEKLLMGFTKLKIWISQIWLARNISTFRA